ncbi:hypothetical protein ACFL1M_04285 [Patescibacteria group bacterium]
MALVFNFFTQLIEVQSPQTEIEVQDLINQIRVEEESDTGMVYPKIADASGKSFLGGNVYTGITLFLYPNWQVKFWQGTYTGVIRGGNLVGGPSGNPVAYTPGVNIQIVQSASSTLLTGALTTEEHDKLMTGLDTSVPQGVWSESLATYNTQGTAGKIVKQIKTRANLAAIKK